MTEVSQLSRTALPTIRHSITRRFQLPQKRDVIVVVDGKPTAQTIVEQVKVYFIVGFYDDARTKPGEVFIRVDRSGSLANGALDAVAMMISIGLQYGIPLHVLIDKLKGSRFEPEGFTRDPEIPSASSVLDLLAKWLAKICPDSAA